MMLSVGGDADPRRPSLISQAYSEPPLNDGGHKARKISVIGGRCLFYGISYSYYIKI